MFKKVNMFKKLCVSLAVAMVATVGLSVPVFAANTQDTTLPSGFISYLSGLNTNVRDKTNTTPVYINNTSGMNLWVYANGVTSYTTPTAALYDTGTTRGGYAIVYGGQWVVHSYIYEDGYRLATLNITSSKSGVSGPLSGVWSPDTAGSYPSAN